MDNQHHNDSHGPSHYVKIWVILLVLLIVSICGPMLGIRWLMLITAFGIAIVKAVIVAREFMHLKIERQIISYIFCAMLILVGIFFFGVAPDVMKGSGQQWVKSYDEAAAEAAAKASEHEHAEHAAAAEHAESASDVVIPPPVAAGKSKFSKAWIATPELIAHGKAAFQANCVSCHGNEGKGDGAASAALNPKPRNFTAGTGWKQGRKPSEIFHTVSTGLGGMPSFASLSTDDRWGVVHYVRTLGPHAGEKDTPADLKKIGIDPSKDSAGGGSDQAIPIGLAIDQLTAESGQGESPKKSKK